MYSHKYFDLINEKAIYEFNMFNNFWSKDDYYCFLNTFKYSNEKLILDKYTLYTKNNIRHVYNWFQCFDEKTIRREFEENNLIINALYSNVAGDKYYKESNEFAVVAYKK